jgi:hypothetical protein
MRTLTYTVTTRTGAVKAGITSFTEAKQLVETLGGKMDAVMIDRVQPYNYTGKKKRPTAKAPTNIK